MERLTYNAKIAIVKILTEILKADNIEHRREIEYINEIIHSFGLDDSYKTEVETLTKQQALSIIDKLSIETKNEVAKMMGKMIVVDKDINYNEVKLYNAICKSCNMGTNFNIKDYPDYSLSGPFVNPEDMLE